MSYPIDRITRQIPGTIPERRDTPADKPSAKTAFAEILSSSVNEQTSTSARQQFETAELLRLRLLRSAVANESFPVGTAPLKQPIDGLEQLLKLFIETRDSFPATQENITGDHVTAPPAANGGSGNTYDDMIHKAAEHYRVDPGLIKAVIKAESNFNPRAVSPAGAQGLMQLMPATAHSLGVTDAFDPAQNIMAGTRFLKSMLHRYGGNVDAALAAYNWGPAHVDRKTESLPKETQAYIGKVRKYYSDYTV